MYIIRYCITVVGLHTGPLMRFMYAVSVREPAANNLTERDIYYAQRQMYVRA